MRERGVPKQNKTKQNGGHVRRVKQTPKGKKAKGKKANKAKRQTRQKGKKADSQTGRASRREATRQKTQKKAKKAKRQKAKGKKKAKRTYKGKRQKKAIRLILIHLISFPKKLRFSGWAKIRLLIDPISSLFWVDKNQDQLFGLPRPEKLGKNQVGANPKS